MSTALSRTTRPHLAIWKSKRPAAPKCSVHSTVLTICSRFLRWRVGLMEKSVQKLNLKYAIKPIPNFGEGPDPYQGFQIHDYLQVSFLRQDPRKLLPSPCTHVPMHQLTPYSCQDGHQEDDRSPRTILPGDALT
jgi:hypothetical protein